MNKPAAVIRKLAFILIFTFAVMLCGCANDEYAIEKKYWKAKKDAGKILSNPYATPPNELQRSVEILDKFSREYPNTRLAVDAQFNIANLYLVKQHYDLGRTQLKKIIKDYKDSKELAAQALFVIGNSYEMEDKWPAALEQYKKLISDYPETTRGLQMPVYIAQHYKVKYEPDKMNAALAEAISFYKGVAAKHPQTPLAFNMDMVIAQCYAQMNDWQGATATLNSMLKAYNGKVSMEEILISLANIHGNKLNNPGKAVEILQILLKEYPKTKYIHTVNELIKRYSEKPKN